MNDTARWKSAKSFQELCELTVAWLEGEISFFPGYTGAPASETEEIADPLIQLNEGGMLTLSSQPAHLGDKWRQRAFVEGLALEERAREIAAKALTTDLHILALPPRVSGGYQTPVVVRNGRPRVWVGSTYWPGEMRIFEEHCSPEAQVDLLEAWSVTAIDLKWGREDHLWELLLDEGNSEVSVEPDPDLGLDQDFVY